MCRIWTCPFSKTRQFLGPFSRPSFSSWSYFWCFETQEWSLRFWSSSFEWSCWITRQGYQTNSDRSFYHWLSIYLPSIAYNFVLSSILSQGKILHTRGLKNFYSVSFGFSLSQIISESSSDLSHQSFPQQDADSFSMNTTIGCCWSSQHPMPGKSRYNFHWKRRYSRTNIWVCCPFSWQNLRS